MYQRPGGVTKLMNGLMAKLGSSGLGPSKMVMLEVRGRKSGETRVVAVNIIDVNGQRCLVAPRGNAEWVRNVHAANGQAAIKRGKRRQVRLEEVPVEQRAPIIQAYLKQNSWSTQSNFGISPKGPIEEFQRIAPDHPVFRIIEQ
jgi:deazaflavin-dependent oxidoreductase (nitroreductase family)